MSPTYKVAAWLLSNSIFSTWKVENVCSKKCCSTLGAQPVVVHYRPCFWTFLLCRKIINYWQFYFLPWMNQSNISPFSLCMIPQKLVLSAPSFRLGHSPVWAVHCMRCTAWTGEWPNLKEVAQTTNFCDMHWGLYPEKNVCNF